VEIQHILSETAEVIIPIVSSPTSMHLVGTIPRTTLEKILDLGSLLYESSRDNPDNIPLLEAGTIPLSLAVNSEGDEKVIDLVVLSQSRSWVKLDYAPFMVTEGTPVRKILFMFTMLGGSELWVTYKGKLVGFITKQGLVKTLSPF